MNFSPLSLCKYFYLTKSQQRDSGDKFMFEKSQLIQAQEIFYRQCLGRAIKDNPALFQSDNTITEC